MNLSQEIAPREFNSIEEITDYFDQHPVQLVKYVRGATAVNASVLGIHLVQLSKLVDTPLEYMGEEALVPPYFFVLPGCFSNISKIISLAHTELQERKF